MEKTVCIKVCKSCAWEKKKIRRALKSLQAAHPRQIEVVKESCLDHCKQDPVVIVGKDVLAPAKPKRIRKAVESLLR